MKILIAELGVPDATTQFRRRLSAVADEIDVVVATRDPLPSLEGYHGLLLTGSGSSVYAPEPWMAPLAGWALQGAADGVGVLGVCFGHQLLGWRLGGRVAKNERGPEHGTASVELTEAGMVDPLFHGLPRQLAVQQVHGDHLVEPPTATGTVRLAESEHTPWQAFRWHNVVGVQFHPEVDRNLLIEIIGDAPATHPCEDAPESERVLHNWARTLGDPRG